MPDCKTITRHQCSELMSYPTQLTIILYPIGTSYLPNGVWTAKTGEPAGTHCPTHTTHGRVVPCMNSTHNPPGRVGPPPLLT